MHEGSRKAIVAAFLANLGIAIIKFIGAAITGSAGLLAEGVHSLADTGNQGLLFLGGSRARRQATPEHPFGFARERYFWSFVVALVLFSMGGLFAIYEGIDKLIHPHAPESLWVAISILVLSIVLESLSLRTARHESIPLKGRHSWWGFIRTSRNPELPVVLLAHFTDEPRWDAVGSLAIGILLVAIAIVLAVEMKGLLIGESATPEMQQAIAEAMTNAPAVRRLIHLRTEHLGPDDVLVGAKLEFDSDLTVPALAEAIDDVEARVRSVVPAARVMYVEPDVHRGG